MSDRIPTIEVADCWLWPGLLDKGYARVRVDGGPARRAHRVIYEMLIGPVPDGLELDHLCRVRNCVNPDHLEPVTPQLNTIRAHGVAGTNHRKDTCIHGHEFSLENTYLRPNGNRACRTCRLAAGRRHYWRVRT